MVAESKASQGGKRGVEEELGLSLLLPLVLLLLVYRPLHSGVKLDMSMEVSQSNVCVRGAEGGGAGGGAVGEGDGG